MLSSSVISRPRLELLGGHQRIAYLDRHRDVVVEVAPTAAVTLVRLVKALACVLAHGLEHLVAHRSIGLLLGRDHRLAYEPSSVPSTFQPSSGSSATTARTGGVEGAGERCEPGEHGPFVVVEQRVRPVDGRPQGLVALERDPPAACEGRKRSSSSMSISPTPSDAARAASSIAAGCRRAARTAR
jgi:hypothetical protein